MEENNISTDYSDTIKLYDYESMVNELNNSAIYDELKFLDTINDKIIAFSKHYNDIAKFSEYKNLSFPVLYDMYCQSGDTERIMFLTLFNIYNPNQYEDFIRYVHQNISSELDENVVVEEIQIKPKKKKKTK